MRLRTAAITLALSLATLLVSGTASAACMNKFVSRPDGNKQVVTLLTGKYTFDEAKALSAAIAGGQAPPIQWLNESGRAVSNQYGALKVVRPMPVGCDGKASGVVVVVTFMNPNTPHQKMQVKLDPSTTVTFDEQAE
jgi:hypothetical protein